MTDVVKTMQIDNLTTWLELELLRKLGTDNQRERHAAHLLPDAELLELARKELFGDALATLPRWNAREERQRMVSVISATCSRVGRVRHGFSVFDFQVGPITDLTGEGWNRLKAIEAFVKATASHPWCAEISLETKEHRLRCPTAGCEREIASPVAKITIQWAGRSLVREYSL